MSKYEDLKVKLYSGEIGSLCGDPIEQTCKTNTFN